jgi:hypothetical protein
MFDQQAEQGIEMEKESLELLLGQGLSVEKIAKRFGKDPSTVSYWMGKYGLEAGGCCAVCGYDRHLRALAFHHVDPADKRLQISWNGVTQSLATLRTEAQKCVLLCSNCHAEVEDGLIELPATVSAEPRDIPL